MKNSSLNLLWSLLAFIILQFDNFVVASTDKRAALRFCHERRIYTVSMDQCPGGVLLKPNFRHLPECICANGVFMHKGSNSEGAFDGVIANRGLRCMEYKPRQYSDWNLFLSLTHPTAPFNDTVTIIPYETETDRLDYFRLRRYKISDIRDPEAQATREEISREKIFYVAHHRKETDEVIQIGDLCLNKSIGYNDGVYVDDIRGENGNTENVVYPGISTNFRVGPKCDNATTIFNIDDRQKVHFYRQYLGRHCRLSPSCIHDPDTNILLPDLSEEETLDDEEGLQRMTREAKCDQVMEENVQLAEYFTRLLHKQILGYSYLPNSGPFRIIEAAMNVYKSVVSNNVVPHQFLEQVYKYFYYLYFNRLGERKYENKDFTEKLIYTLNHCKLNSRDMHFITKGCPAKVQYYKKAKSLFEYEYVSPELEEDNKFDETKFDVIPDAIFKIVNFVYNYCTPYFDLRTMQRRHFRKEMKMIFSMASLQNRWTKKCDQITKVMQYRSILPYGDLNTIMTNLDATVAAVRMNLTSQDYITRPVPKAPSRKRRSILDYEDYEIWNGAAYCLQMKDYPRTTGPDTWGILPDITRIISP